MASQEKPAGGKNAPQIPNGMKFVLGGLAGMAATLIVQPLDLVKTRMQISGMDSAKKEFRNSFHCMQTVIQNEGLFALYKGIGAGLLRQATYTTARLGIYTWMNEKYKEKYESEPSLPMRMLMGVGAGGGGSFFGTPAEVALIRMVADGRLPKEQRRNYKNVAVALMRIAKEEGVPALWRGCVPTVSRAMVVNMAQLSSYSQAKSFSIRKFGVKEGIGLHFCASMLSGLLTTIVSMPVDIAKTRIQNMKYVNGVPEYKGAGDVLLRVVKHEGVLALWKGFTPYYCRLGPHTVFTFIFLEQFNRLYFKYVMGVTGGSNL